MGRLAFRRSPNNSLVGSQMIIVPKISQLNNKVCIYLCVFVWMFLFGFLIWQILIYIQRVSQIRGIQREFSIGTEEY